MRQQLKNLYHATLGRILHPILLYSALEALENDSRNILHWRQSQALDQTGRYVENHMAHLPSFPISYDLLTHAIKKMDPGNEGLVCEFGVFSGRTINHIAAQLDSKIVHGFDSFEGLPEHFIDGYGEGHFKRTDLPAVRSNVKLIKGWFNETLPPFLSANSGVISFLHVDCDLYSSTKTVFGSLSNRIVPGTIIVFDEYFNYPGWKEGEFKAFAEFRQDSGRSYDYLGYCWQSSQVAVRIR